MMRADDPLEPAARAGTAPDRGPDRWSAAAWILAYVAVAAVVQFVFVRVPHDADTAYHVAVGRLIREHGLLRAFPWTPFSWLAENYADKELLFHLLLAPLSSFDWTTAAHVVGTLAGSALLASLFLVLRTERVRFAGAWALLPLLASPAFVFRFALVRPHLLSIALAITVAWAASRRRLVLLGLASALYPWTYVAWQMPVLLAGAAETARVASGRRIEWRTLAVAAGGIAAGIVLHPNGLNLVRLNWIVLVHVLLQGAWGGRPDLELGDEFRAFTLGEWGLLLAPAAAMGATALALSWRARRDDEGPLAFALAAVAFGLLTLRTARFAEYFVPFSAAAFALTLAAVARRSSLGTPRLVRPSVALAVSLVVCLAYGGRETAGLLARLREWPRTLGDEQARVLSARIPAGAQVFTCEWGLTGVLMLALPDRRFVVALDPTLFALKDPELYHLWYRLPREAPPGLARTIRERFGARYVACFWDQRFEKFFQRIAFEPGVTTVLFDEYWNVYELRDP